MSNNDQKLDRIQEDITHIKVTLARNTTSLEEHMRRTEILEKKIEPLEKNMYRILGAVALLAVMAEILFRH